jgi:hypothetical protein
VELAAIVPQGRERSEGGGMSLHRRAARRDNNDPELRTFAERMGWRLWQLKEPCDYIGLRRGVWFAIEIKNPDCEGHKDEFTYDEKKFIAEVSAVGGRILLWRTKDDVIRDSQARISA